MNVREEPGCVNIPDWLIGQEAQVRLSAFLAVFAVLLIL